MSVKQRIAVGLLTLSLAGVGAWQAHEGFTPAPVIPTQGDVPTIGHGSTHYEDGTPVRMTDAPITRKRAAELARNLNRKSEREFAESLPNVALTQGEFDLYTDFVGQYGIGAWKESSSRQHLLAHEYAPACDALLAYRYMTSRTYIAGWEPYRFGKTGRPTRWRFDCSTPGNKVCRGVWKRQLDRHSKCLAEQP